MQITVKAYAKINWALNILGIRENGYHELDMLMHSINLYDELMFASANMVTLTVDGRSLPTGGRNLIVRAANALKEYTGSREGARINLIKRIPVRAGLGGGSADCAATLVALNKLWGLNLSAQTLKDIGQTLGADVPFCLQGGFAHVYGVGEHIEPLEAPPEMYLVMLHPGGGLSTANVFSTWDAGDYKCIPMDMYASHRAIVSGDFAALRTHSGNVLEPPAIQLMGEIAEAKARLYALGAQFAQMSGSGSVVFGVFATQADAEKARDALGPRAILTQTLAAID